MTHDMFCRHAKALLAFCDYPAVQYKVKFTLLGTPYEDRGLSLCGEEPSPFLREISEGYARWERVEKEEKGGATGCTVESV